MLLAERAMWSNSVGAPFILPPKHAAVFRKAAADLSEYADVVEDAGVDETVFERLTREQKQLAILLVARALLDPLSEPPRITAVLAGTVAAIYEHLLCLGLRPVEDTGPSGQASGFADADPQTGGRALRPADSQTATDDAGSHLA